MDDKAFLHNKYILKNYRILVVTLEQIQVGHDKYAAKASGLLNKMEQFNTSFGLKLAYLIFAPTEQFSTNLQAIDVTVQEALRGAALLVSHLKSLKTETMYIGFYDHTVEESGSLTKNRSYQKFVRCLEELIMGHLHIHLPVLSICIIMLIMKL